jgi:hypothetical protein
MKRLLTQLTIGGPRAVIIVVGAVLAVWIAIEWLMRILS